MVMEAIECYWLASCQWAELERQVTCDDGREMRQYKDNSIRIPIVCGIYYCMPVLQLYRHIGILSVRHTQISARE